MVDTVLLILILVASVISASANVYMLIGELQKHAEKKQEAACEAAMEEASGSDPISEFQKQLGNLLAYNGMPQSASMDADREAADD